jgi:hypothetical protein
MASQNKRQYKAQATRINPSDFEDHTYEHRSYWQKEWLNKSYDESLLKPITPPSFRTEEYTDEYIVDPRFWTVN